MKTYSLLWFRIFITGITVIGLFLPARNVTAKADVLYNGDFELGNLQLHGNEISGWQQDGWKIGRSDFAWDFLYAHSGLRSAKITNIYKNEARWVQTIQVQPHSIYRLSGWIRTRNIPMGTVQGASLAVAGTDIHTKPMIGDHDWTYVYLDFTTKEEAYVQIAASLGGDEGRVSGTAWFDDIHLDLINNSLCFSLNAQMSPPLVGETIEVSPAPNCNNGTQYAYGTQVTLKAIPLAGSGYQFDHWQDGFTHLDNPVTVAMTSDLDLTAFFSAGGRKATSWKILTLIYKDVDFTYFDLAGKHHFVSEMTPSEVDRAVSAVKQFVNSDIPELTDGMVEASLTVVLPNHPLTELQRFCGFYPSKQETKADLDRTYDSVIVIWDSIGIDDIGTELNIAKCGGLTYPNGTAQTYSTIPFNSISVYQQNVFKHEWGHAILAYFDAAGVTPEPVVNNHINSTDHQYVNCLTGEPYELENELFADSLPNSIYNNYSGFTHDYYSGLTATIDDPTTCLGISASAWAYGGPVIHEGETVPGLINKALE